MLKLKRIAITGGVASGKTSVCQLFKELGAFVVSADAIVHELLRPDTDLGRQIILQFGTEILENGKFSRRILAEKVFDDSKRLEILEELLHPAVLKQIEELYSRARKEGKYSSFVVETDEKVAKRRFELAGFQPEEYEKRMKRQIKPSEKASRAHYTIQNNGTLEDLRKQVVKLNQTIQET